MVEYDPKDGRVWSADEQALKDMAARLCGVAGVRSVNVSRCHARDGKPNERYALAVWWVSETYEQQEADILTRYLRP